MKLKKCKYGHYYDEDKFSMCPHCSSKGIKANKTIEIKDSVDKQVTQKKSESANGGKALKDAVKDALEEKQKKEEQQRKERKVSALNPVGMLVCTDGMQSGNVFSLTSGENYIGCLRNGELIVTSMMKNEISYFLEVQYQPANNSFLIVPIQSEVGMIVNDSRIEQETKLNAYDKIAVRDNMLMFVPICGEHFSWE